uniref:Putative HC-toxin efflux carrier TOXA n=1 Tax=Talaromyces marneffei PM1 TaxID=1077442 RepID=A0A093UWT5_TALMA
MADRLLEPVWTKAQTLPTEAAASPSINETTTALGRPEALLEKSQHDMESSTSEEMDDEDTVYPTCLKAASIMISLYLAIFLVALDRTIIATAIPQITDEFNSLSDIGWYASSYMMTSCAFQLFYGKLYVFDPTKWGFLSAIMLFEIGSAICGAAPNSVAFIWGRSIAGFGCSGIFSGAIVVMVPHNPARKEALYSRVFSVPFLALHPLLARLLEEHSLLISLGAGYDSYSISI